MKICTKTINNIGDSAIQMVQLPLPDYFQPNLLGILRRKVIFFKSIFFRLLRCLRMDILHNNNKSSRQKAIIRWEIMRVYSIHPFCSQPTIVFSSWLYFLQLEGRLREAEVGIPSGCHRNGTLIKIKTESNLYKHETHLELLEMPTFF